MRVDNNKNCGRAEISLAIAYFGANGYTVSLPISDTQWYDLIVEKDGIFQAVQCKFSSTNNREISFVSKGETKDVAYDRLTDHPLDLLFCADSDMNMFVIPMTDIVESGNIRSIVLRSERNTNGQGFNTYKYKVTI